MVEKKTTKKTAGAAPALSAVGSRILIIRGHRVLSDEDLAGLYGVEVQALNQAIKRNADRFPDDFMSQLTAEEAEALRSKCVILDANLKSQSVTSNAGRGKHRK